MPSGVCCCGAIRAFSLEKEENSEGAHTGAPGVQTTPLCQGHVTKQRSVQPRSEFSCAKEKANNNFHPPTMPLHHRRNKGATWWRSPWQPARGTMVTNHQGRHVTGHMTGPRDLPRDTNDTGTARADK